MSKRTRRGGKAPTLEEIYLNKNYKDPPDRMFETIFEEPKPTGDVGKETWTTVRRYKRRIDFEGVMAKSKINLRKKKAKLILKGRKTKKLTNEVFQKHLEELENESLVPSCSRDNNYRNIPELSSDSHIDINMNVQSDNMSLDANSNISNEEDMNLTTDNSSLMEEDLNSSKQINEVLAETNNIPDLNFSASSDVPDDKNNNSLPDFEHFTDGASFSFGFDENVPTGESSAKKVKIGSNQRRKRRDSGFVVGWRMTRSRSRMIQDFENEISESCSEPVLEQEFESIGIFEESKPVDVAKTDLDMSEI